MQDDEELVRRAQANDSEAFGLLYERYFDRVYRYVMYRVGNVAEAEDVTGEVFLRALESIDRFHWRGLPFVAWLFRIASNQVIDRARRNSRREWVPIDDVALVSDTNPEGEVERQLTGEEVVTALQDLTDLQQQVIAMRFASELSIAETAASLNKSEGAVKAAQHAALAALERALIRRQRSAAGEPAL